MQFGDPTLNPIYGAGEIDSPRVCLIFMNPTARNVASVDSWRGLRAPWIGTKNIWRMLNELALFNNKELMHRINEMKPADWDEEFSEQLYREIAKESLYITNIAKCTQIDARHLPDSTFKHFLPSLYEELDTINPEVTFTFGNQVSSLVLGRHISVSNYQNSESELIQLPNNKLSIYPTYYPVGQGMRNMSRAISRINIVLNNND